MTWLLVGVGDSVGDLAGDSSVINLIVMMLLDELLLHAATSAAAHAANDAADAQQNKDYANQDQGPERYHANSNVVIEIDAIARAALRVPNTLLEETKVVASRSIIVVIPICLVTALCKRGKSACND